MENVSVPVAWLAAGLWAVTMALAGALGRAVYGRLSEMAESLHELNETVGGLKTSHARVEERLSAALERIDRLEEHGSCARH